MKARVSNLYRTEAEWKTINFIPYEGELIIYAPDTKHDYTRIKIGDGKTLLNSLPFCVEAYVEEMLNKYQHKTIADAGRIINYL